MTIDLHGSLPAPGTRLRARLESGGRLSDVVAADPSSASESSATDPSFGDWVRPHWQVLQRFAARLVPADDRDDLLQDVLERAWRKRHTFDPARGSARSWLLAVMADRARRFRTRARPVAASLESRRDEAAPAVDHDDGLVLRAAVALLSDRRRLAVELHYYVGLPIAEVAAVMQCADGTVRATLAAARAELRTTLQHQDDQERAR